MHRATLCVYACVCVCTKDRETLCVLYCMQACVCVCTCESVCARETAPAKAETTSESILKDNYNETTGGCSHEESWGIITA